MSARNHAPDWSAKGQAFRSLDGTPATLGTDWRASKPGHEAPRARASIEAWRTAPAVRREYERGLRNGWIGAGAFYALGTILLWLAFHTLAVHP